MEKILLVKRSKMIFLLLITNNRMFGTCMENKIELDWQAPYPNE